MVKSKQPTVQEIALRFCIDNREPEKEFVLLTHDEMVKECAKWVGSPLHKSFAELINTQLEKQEIAKRLEKYASRKAK